jgi:glutamate--cysteine ligase
MPSPVRCITTRDVRCHVDEHVFDVGDVTSTRRKVGIELEWITRSSVAAPLPDVRVMREAIGAHLPGGARITFEPGGQLELSGPPHVGVDDAIAAMTDDALIARRAVAELGVDLVGIGLDPAGARQRVLDDGRYRAMEQYFDTRWPEGRTMMRSTAALQINVDLGASELLESRWTRAHEIIPALTAMFANSPFDEFGRPTGWRSSRLAVWHQLDPRRTRAAARPGMGAASAWTSYALDAPVMMIPTGTTFTPLTRPFPFARWIHAGHELGWPTLDDFAYHLTTLFAPVRPRGWLELRSIDALPDEWWPVALGVTTALLDDGEAAEVATRAAASVRGRATDAARRACSDPELRRAADRSFVAALDALPRIGATAVVPRAEEYYERYVARGRCPADDLHPDPSRLSPVA